MQPRIGQYSLTPPLFLDLLSRCWCFPKRWRESCRRDEDVEFIDSYESKVE